MNQKFHTQLECADTYNLQRKKRTLALMSEQARNLLEALPALFHFNDRAMPGFIDDQTPYGIEKFIQDQPIKACHALGITTPQDTIISPDILGIYTMGSLGSFGFNNASDLDIWVIHRSDIPQEACLKLQNKCTLIENYYLTKGLELCCYLVHPGQFIQGHHTLLDLEHSGSAQHWLLLDEFYRTHICLSGWSILWWESTASETPENLLNLGDIKHLPASEYFGASMWQLFKGIDAPHKALMKILLLEVYAEGYPSPKMLSQSLWEQVYQDPDALHDPYLILLNKITDYLQGKQDTYRLQVIRQCFYLKSGLKLTQKAPFQDWRYEKLQELAQAWGWTQEDIEPLDRVNTWHAGQVRTFNMQLDQLLMMSHQKLIAFANRHELDHSLMFDELGVLTRKLHTRFSEESSRIQILSAIDHHDLREDHLNIMALKGKEEAHPFCVSPHPLSLKRSDPTTSFIDGPSITALIFWCCLNQVAHWKTDWFDASRSTRKNHHRPLARHLLNVIPRPQPIALEQLKHPWFIERAVIILNQEHDPTMAISWHQRILASVSRNLLSYGSDNTNLLGSLELFTQNSWGEWHYFQYQGDTALLEATKKLTEGAFNPDDVDVSVYSCSKYLKTALTDEVLFSLYTSLQLFHQTKKYNLSIEVKEISGQGYGLFFNRIGLSYQKLDQHEEIFSYYTHGTISRQPNIEGFKHTISPILELIYDHAAEGMTQYFILQNKKGLDVFISSTTNQISEYHVKETTLLDLMEQVKKAHIHTPEGKKLQFNLPQFYWLKQEQEVWHLEPFGPKWHKFKK